MDLAMQQVATTMALLVLTAVLPLVPAVGIYKLFPDTKVAVSGPLSGLTLKAGGSFAAYLAVLIALAPFTYRTFDVLPIITTASWSVSGTVRVFDAQGKPVPYMDWPAGTVKVQVAPQNVSVIGNRFDAKVTTTDGKLPMLWLSYENDPSEDVIPLGDDSGKYKLKRDMGKRSIVIGQDVSIHRHAAPSASYAPAATAQLAGTP